MANELPRRAQEAVDLMDEAAALYESNRCTCPKRAAELHQKLHEAFDYLTMRRIYPDLVERCKRLKLQFKTLKVRLESGSLVS